MVQVIEKVYCHGELVMQVNRKSRKSIAECRAWAEAIDDAKIVPMGQNAIRVYLPMDSAELGYRNVIEAIGE